LTKAGTVLILIMFIFESILIVPLFWTIPSFVLISKINKGKATEGNKIALSVLGIIFGGLLGIIGGILILVDLKTIDNGPVQVVNVEKKGFY